MHALKKIDIILGAPDLHRLTRLLEHHGLASTVDHHVTGRGDRGVRGDDDLTGVFSNICLMTACPADQLVAVVETVRPLLKKPAASASCATSRA